MADIFTKRLGKVKFIRFCETLGLRVLEGMTLTYFLSHHLCSAVGRGNRPCTWLYIGRTMSWGTVTVHPLIVR